MASHPASVTSLSFVFKWLGKSQVESGEGGGQSRDHFLGQWPPATAEPRKVPNCGRNEAISHIDL